MENASQLRPLSHTFQLCSLSNVFPISCIPRLIYSLLHLFCISSCLIPYLFHVSAQIVPQPSGRLGCISTFGSCLKSCLDSSHVSQSVIHTKEEKSSPQASPRRVVTCTQSVPCFLTPHETKALTSCTVNAESLKSSVQKIIIDSRATDHFFSNRAYFFN